MKLSPSMKSLIAMAAPALALTVAVLAGASPAAAQIAKGSKQPLDITADQLETHNADCVAVWTGSAEAMQDTSRLRSNIMIVHMEVTKGKPGAATTTGASSNGCGAMTSLEAKTNVYYLSGDGRRVHGDNAFYDAATKLITITGDVTAVDGQNVMRGTKMVYNMDTGEGHIEGGAKGPTSKNRPRGVFYPKDANTDAAAPADAKPDAKPKKAAK
jgi:lipopolysaccharide export system protein LptA